MKLRGCPECTYSHFGQFQTRHQACTRIVILRSTRQRAKREYVHSGQPFGVKKSTRKLVHFPAKLRLGWSISLLNYEQSWSFSLQNYEQAGPFPCRTTSKPGHFPSRTTSKEYKLHYYYLSTWEDEISQISSLHHFFLNLVVGTIINHHYLSDQAGGVFRDVHSGQPLCTF